MNCYESSWYQCPTQVPVLKCCAVRWSSRSEAFWQIHTMFVIFMGWVLSIRIANVVTNCLTWSIWQYLLMFWQICGTVWRVINAVAQEKQDSILWKWIFNMDQSHDTLWSQHWPIWFKINKATKTTTWMIYPANLVVKCFWGTEMWDI